MADIEQEAFKRDRRFLVRLVLVLILAVGAGFFIFAQLTGSRARGCAADTVSGVAGGSGSE
jgi:hypothetical protein